MALNYTTYISVISNMLVVDPTDPNFVAIMPDVIDYAEQRIYREADLLNTVVRDSSATLSVGTRTFNLPTSLGRFVVTNGFNVITPASQTAPDNGTRNQLVAQSLDYMDAAWPSAASAGLPVCYAMVTDQQIAVGPFPDASYTVEVKGTIRPEPLSATNTTTYLTNFLPDLFVAASMIFGAGYQKNFGAQSDDPRMSSSWEDQYTKLFASANVEEMRKKYASGAWGSLQPTPLASPSR